MLRAFQPETHMAQDRRLVGLRLDPPAHRELKRLADEENRSVAQMAELLHYEAMALRRKRADCAAQQT